MRTDGSDERLLTRSALDESADMVAQWPGDPVQSQKTTRTKQHQTVYD